MKVSFSIKLSEKDLYLFNLRQAYRGMQGFLSILLPVLVFAYAIVGYGQVSPWSTLVYIGLGIVFLVYVPISLWLRVRKVMRDENNAVSKTLRYQFEEEKIQVAVEKEQAEFLWDNIYRMISTKNYVYIYTNRMNAYILPMVQVGDSYKDLSELAHAKLPKHRIQMK
jgi:Ca2+/Na+ antiporter